ncbi:hypothetical protein EBB07_20500 [Paenibacillaceae bacterium]|nr:hypothetical protein EBB07_20500 [Paenibacillaceae bacterium]
MEALIKYIHNKQFWTDFLWLTAEDRTYPELENAIVSLPITDRLMLQLELDEDFSLLSLLLVERSKEEGVEIAWDDEAHPHPFALRLEELDAISDAASRYPGYNGPSALPFLLLFRFTAVLPEEWHRFETKLTAAFNSLQLFTAEELGELIAHITHMKFLDFHWIHTGQNWVLVGDDAYSLRNHHNDQFPFAQLEEIIQSLG